VTPEIETVPVERFHEALEIAAPLAFPVQWRRLSLVHWSMAADDHVLRYVFRHVRPTRHLEFGTWKGDGVLRCVEECDATVWTINIPQGEVKPGGDWAYSEKESDECQASATWTERMVTDKGVWIRTDSYGMIGRKYLDAGCGHRVCQIYADSRAWDTRGYPDHFFDTAFIDGGHAADIVASDTRNALRLVRPGGLVIWHDFCPLDEVTSACASTRDVVKYITENRYALFPHFDRLFWVEPSWLLVGIRVGCE
jgi:methyltransferase family protein